MENLYKLGKLELRNRTVTNGSWYRSIVFLFCSFALAVCFFFHFNFPCSLAMTFQLISCNWNSTFFVKNENNWTWPRNDDGRSSPCGRTSMIRRLPYNAMPTPTYCNAVPRGRAAQTFAPLYFLPELSISIHRRRGDLDELSRWRADEPSWRQRSSCTWCSGGTAQKNRTSDPRTFLNS